MNRRPFISAELVALTAASGAAVWVLPSGSVGRVIAGCLLVLVLPGFALAELLAGPEPYRGAGRILLIPGLSVSVVILVSAVLYVTGVRLDLHSWDISVGAVTVVAAVAGAIARSPVQDLVSLPVKPLAILLVGAILSGCLLAATVLATTHSVRQSERADRFTQLWALPTGPGRRSARIGVYNHEGRATTYVLRTFLDSRLASTRSISVRSGVTWTATRKLARRVRTMRVTLSLASAPDTLFRAVHLNLVPS